MTLNERLNLRLDIYFKLTKIQQRKLSELGHSHLMYDTTMTLNEFKSITKNKQLIADFTRLKFSQPLKLVA